jgi:hypothetical protein
MTKKRNALSMLALVAVSGVMLSTAAMAQGMGDGPMGDGPMGRGAMAGLDFGAVDADKDGKITTAEMDAFRAARVTEMDTDKDGKLSTAELSAMHMARMQERADQMATRMVERHDADGDGMLTAAEFATPAAPERMFEMADADGDGALTEAEIEAARSKMAEMRDGRGKGGKHGRGEGHGEGHGSRWFFN